MPSTRRLGFAADKARRAVDVQRFAQWVFLQQVADATPDVLWSLHAVAADRVVGVALDEPNTDALQRWAEEWHLTDPWLLAHARATWRAARGHDLEQAKVWRARAWSDRDDLKGRLVPARSRRGLAADRPLKKPEHFVWLVQYQVLGQPFRTPTINEACHTLADLIGLTLREPEMGWTRRNRQRQSAQ
jgi:hypothetical protein